MTGDCTELKTVDGGSVCPVYPVCSVCSVCIEPVDPKDGTSCPRCGARHHGACYRGYGRCVVPGCFAGVDLEKISDDYVDLEADLALVASAMRVGFWVRTVTLSLFSLVAAELDPISLDTC